MNRQRGLTLVELLIAMAISAIIAVVSIRLFSTSVDTKKSIEAQSGIFSELTRTLGIIERDIAQLAPYRKVRTPYGEYNDFLTLDYNGLQLTRNGWSISPYQTYQRSSLQRVQYRMAPRGSELCEYHDSNDKRNTPCFVRSYTAQLDDDGSFVWRHQVLSEHVATVEWQFLVLDETTNQTKFTSSLPQSQDLNSSALLQVKAIEVILELEDGREFSRLIISPMQINEDTAQSS